MQHTSHSEFRRHPAVTLDSVVDDHEPVVITRARGFHERAWEDYPHSRSTDAKLLERVNA